MFIGADAETSAVLSKREAMQVPKKRNHNVKYKLPSKLSQHDTH